MKYGRLKYYITIVALAVFGISVAAQPRMACALDEASIKADRKNAARYYYKAFNLLKYPESKEANNKIQGVIKEGWKSKDDELEDILAQNESALREFKRGVELARCDFDFGQTYTYLIQKEPPPYLKIKNISRLLLLKGRYYESKRDYDSAIETYLSNLSFARHIAQDKTLLLKMIALVIEKETYLPLQDLLNSEALEKKQLLRIFNYLQEYKKRHFSAREMVELERESFMSSVHLIVDRYLEDSKVESNEQMSGAEKGEVIAFSNEIVKQAQELTDKYYGNFIKAIESNKPEDWAFATDELNTLMKGVQPSAANFPDFVKGMMEDCLKDNPAVLNEKIARRLVVTLLSVAIPNFKGIGEGYHSTLSQLEEVKSLVLIKASEKSR